MHSPEHRDNILSPGYQNVGIGVYCAPTDRSGPPPSSAGRGAPGSPPAYSGGTAPNPVARADADTIGC